jgi:hypothetical protein
VFNEESGMLKGKIADLGGADQEKFSPNLLTSSTWYGTTPNDYGRIHLPDK